MITAASQIRTLHDVDPRELAILDIVRNTARLPRWNGSLAPASVWSVSDHMALIEVSIKECDRWARLAESLAFGEGYVLAAAHAELAHMDVDDHREAQRVLTAVLGPGWVHK